MKIVNCRMKVANWALDERLDSILIEAVIAEQE
jgi:hypothetical protein